MRLIALSQVKNEIDVIELFVRYTLQYVDGLFVVDNASSDGTRERLSDLARTLPLAVIDDPRTVNLQGERMTALYRRAIRALDVDFVLPLDADELLRAGTRADLERALAAVPRGAWARIPWQTYVLRPEDARGPGDLLRRLRFRRRTETEYEKIIVPARAEWADRAILAYGNHAVCTDDGATPPSVALDGVTLAHFPVRSVAQLEAKVIVGWLSQLARNPDSARGDESHHWRDIFAILRERRLSTEDASRISMNYARRGDPLAPFGPTDLVEDPVPSDAAARCVPLEIDPLVTVARAAASALTTSRDTSLLLGPMRGWRWRWRDRHRIEALGLAPAERSGAISLLRDRFRPRSILALGAASLPFLAGLEEDDSVHVTRATTPGGVAGPSAFDLVLAIGADRALAPEAIAARAAGPIVFSSARGGSPREWERRWESAGYAVDGWLSASLAVLAAPGRDRPPLVLARKGQETPGRLDRAALRALRR